MSFSDFNLDARLLSAVKRAGYETPTPIQAKAIPVALEGQDLIGTAQTGTGKTAAFVLPILQRLLSGPRGRARSLIVTPTRELAEQIHDNLALLAKGTNIRSATIYGGVSMGPQEKALRDGVEILVACPGRLLDHLQRGTTKLDHVEVLVLDEADRMFDMGFLPSVRQIIARVPKQRQTMLFSATFPDEVESLARDVLRQPARVSIGIAQPAQTVSHALYPVPQHLKTDLLMALLKQTDAFSMLVFTRTKHRADRLARHISKHGMMVTALHSNRSQNQRQQALSGFKSGKFQVMVATDIAARGLDIETVSHVINFDVPDTPDAYIHRIGRTGRAEREGDAFTLITPEDSATVRDIERALGKKIERLQLDSFDYGVALAEPRAHNHEAHAAPAFRAGAPTKLPGAQPSPTSAAARPAYRSRGNSFSRRGNFSRRRRSAR